MQAIILAGGKGSRLKPFTNSFPKPLVPVGDKAILEIVLLQLKQAGVVKVVLAVNHLAHLIRAFFGDGSQMGIEITYSQELEPLGTAGPLRLVKNLDEDFLVMNGDLLTTLSYKDLFNSHVKGGHVATIGTYEKELKIDLGVIQSQKGILTDYIEKPVKRFMVSMGIYAFHRSVVDLIPKEGRFDLPDLILKIRSHGSDVHCFQGNYYWLDIGRVEDYEEAGRIFEERRGEFLKGG
jgi:NDP-mannose synthase